MFLVGNKTSTKCQNGYYFLEYYAYGPNDVHVNIQKASRRIGCCIWQCELLVDIPMHVTVAIYKFVP